MTILEAAAAWVAYLGTLELKEGTVDVYCRDIARFAKVLGGDKGLDAITVLRVNGYLKSNALLKSPKGRLLAKPTVDRSKRVCKMFLQWLVSAGHAPDLPAGVINVFKP